MTVLNAPTPVTLSIAGSDPSGGAGIQADLKTFHQHQTFGTTVITLLTVQNTQSVSQVQMVDVDFVLAQLAAVESDMPVAAAKTGALGSVEMIEAIASQAAEFSFPLVVDPVMISKHGTPLMALEAGQTLKTQLLPHAFLVTPNLDEAAALTGRSVDSIASMETAARAIADAGPTHVLVKGGHLAGEAVDVLFSEGQAHHFRSPRMATKNTHGTGCVTSAAITANLAHGESVADAVGRAKRFITQAIETNPQLGGGYGPVNMFANR
jgi:hydroxymethylpyrimidine/phosphomethylpyrimidine kinase